MNAMADEAEASTPDYSPDEEGDDLRAREEDDQYEREDPEDRYLDASWEDSNERNMEGCCGDF